EMPVDVRDLIAEQFVIHLVGVEHAGQGLRDVRDLLNEGRPLARRQGEQFGGVALQHEYRPARKKLVVVEVRNGFAEVGDPLLGAGPLPRARRTVRWWSCHRRPARKRSRRRKPSWMRSSDAAYENRRYPSALPPKAIPGVTATWQRSRSSRASRRESPSKRRPSAST